MNIQWYPGHMTKTRRQMAENLKLVDAVCEIIDARIPYSSRNPDIDDMFSSKPRLVLLNKADQADANITRRWKDYFRAQGMAVLETDCKTRKGINDFAPTLRELLKPQIEKWNEKGLVGKTIRVMVVGIPNVGKSTLINQLAKRKTAKTEDRPGVTRGAQWVTVDDKLELLDTPGILWPKFDDPMVGLRLAFTGAVKDQIMDVETLAFELMKLMAVEYPEKVRERYKFDPDPSLEGWELLEMAGRKRGFLISGGEIDLDRMARVLLDEYRAGKLGRISLETPEMLKQEA